MRVLFHRYVPFLLLLSALALWAWVGYFLWILLSEERAYAEEIGSLQEAGAEHLAALRLHVLSRETRAARGELEKLVHAEVIDMIESIEAVGRHAGVPITIGEATLVPDGENTHLRTVEFLVEGEGGFSKIMHAAALFESLPTPSFVADMQFEYLSETGAKSVTRTWRLVARIHFLTSVGIES